MRGCASLGHEGVNPCGCPLGIAPGSTPCAPTPHRNTLSCTTTSTSHEHTRTLPHQNHRRRTQHRVPTRHEHAHSNYGYRPPEDHQAATGKRQSHDPMNPYDRPHNGFGHPPRTHPQVALPETPSACPHCASPTSGRPTNCTIPTPQHHNRRTPTQQIARGNQPHRSDRAAPDTVIGRARPVDGMNRSQPEPAREVTVR